MLIDLDSRTFVIPKYAGASVDVRPLSVEAFQACVRALEKNKQAGAVALMADADTLRVAKEVLGVHALNLKGITVRVGGVTRDATVQDLTAHAPLFTAALSILTHLVTISAITEADAGNSDGPLPNSPN